MGGSDAGRPAQLDRVELRDGFRLAIRPVRPDDKQAIADGFERLSAQSRYRRFFSPLNRLGDRDLAYLTEVDHSDHEALVGFDPATRRAVGVARYVREPGADTAEVAVTVVDEWHGRGVATTLLERLSARARDEGIRHFVALVLEENADAIELFRELAPRHSERREAGADYVEFRFDLPGPDEGFRISALAEALRLAARTAWTINPWPVLRERIGARSQNRPDR